MPRTHRNPARFRATLALAGAVALVPALRVCGFAPARAATKPAPKPAPKAAPAPSNDQRRLITFDTCSRVIEGDLIEAKQVGLIRLIGVMAPVKGEPGYDEALALTKRLALGKAIKVEICPERPNDTQKRIRAVVYLPDGTNLNTKLLRNGAVRLLDHKPCHIDVKSWQKYEEEAQKAKVGIFAEAPAPKGAQKPSSSRVHIRPRD